MTKRICVFSFYGCNIPYLSQLIMSRLFFLFLGVILFSACSQGRKLSAEPLDDIQDLPEMVVTADSFTPEDAKPVYPYRPSENRPFDLLHTRLKVSFNWEKQWLLGEAFLRMTPLAYPQDSVVLDAVGFIIRHVRDIARKDTLAYKYDHSELTIYLPCTQRRGDTLDLEIQYTARPNENPEGGSDAIRGDKGLYFINPVGQYKDKPRQVWTQGETQSNSRWFPTFDQPNERCTQEMHITVDTIFETLSNGLLINQKFNPGGTRTDIWRMDLPHAPYLFMMAIGDYAIREESWKDMPLTYYVEKDFAAHALEIFPEAQGMLSYFSDYVGVRYPWSKYSQVVVRDYVSGAMENTTAVIYGEFMQHTGRELIDERQNELIGAHELIHHWFGDLVTCESWSNLVMNEGFANYGEYLWLEFKYGPDEAELHRRSELEGYLNESGRKRHPLVDYHYAQQEDMFDAHSYNKGGLVLHMLRNYIGEAAFRLGIKKYLVENAYQPVEAHDLRLAMEAVSGQDLNWFFNQWFYEPGHPTLDWQWSYDNVSQRLIVEINQIQDTEKNFSTYRLPTEIAVVLSRDKVLRLPLLIDERYQSFSWSLAEEPIIVDLDPDRTLLVEQQIDWSVDAAKAYWRLNPMVWTRTDILDILEEEGDLLVPVPWNDPHWSIRARGTGWLDAADPSQATRLLDLAKKDVHSEVRASAIAQLANESFEGYVKMAEEVLTKEQAYNVVHEVLNGLSQIDLAAAFQAAKKMEVDSSVTGALITGGFYARLGDAEQLSYFDKSWNWVNGMTRLLYIKNYVDILHLGSDAQIRTGISRLSDEALATEWSPVRRFAAFRGLALLRQQLLKKQPELAKEIVLKMDIIKKKEQDPELQNYYQNY